MHPALRALSAFHQGLSGLLGSSGCLTYMMELMVSATTRIPLSIASPSPRTTAIVAGARHGEQSTQPVVYVSSVACA